MNKDKTYQASPELAAEMRHCLTRAVTLLERGWTKQRFARGADGEDRDPTSESACKWCLQGALMRARSELEEANGAPNHPRLRSALELCVFRRMEMPVALPTFNDRIAKSKDEVVSLLKDALQNGVVEVS